MPCHDMSIVTIWPPSALYPQGVEPVDARTRESLQRSVQLAIEITTRSQEARAKHEALREQEKAKGKLEQQAQTA